MKLMTYAGFLLGAAASMGAQDQDHLLYFQQAVPPPGSGVQRTVQFVSGQIVGNAVKASPYSAESVMETTQTLLDGNRIVNRTVTRQYRDSEGRERREMSLGPREAEQVVMISDPVAGTSFTLHPANKTAEKMPLAHLAPLPGWAVGEALAGPALADVTIQTTHKALIIRQGAPGVSEGTRTNDTEENLGARVMEGVMAQGTRRRTTIPAGQIGNEKAIEVVSETWFSPDLRMTVLSETTDPRMGKTVMKLTNISRSEPARSLFEVPPDYTMVGIDEGFKVKLKDATEGTNVEILKLKKEIERRR